MRTPIPLSSARGTVREVEYAASAVCPAATSWRGSDWSRCAVIPLRCTAPDGRTSLFPASSSGTATATAPADGDGDHSGRHCGRRGESAGTAAPADGQYPVGEARSRRRLRGGLSAQRPAHEFPDVHGPTSTGE